jgi:hypothetical protein
MQLKKLWEAASAIDKDLSK